jgi:hypothetical protein
MKTKPIPVRIEESDIELATKLNISIPKLFREILKREIANKLNKCPYCGHDKGLENESNSCYASVCGNDF